MDEIARTWCRAARRDPQVVVADGDRFACTWDTTDPDGSVRTGIDVCTVGPDGRVSESWSIAGERPATITPGEPGDPATRERIAERCEAWSPMWNGDVDLADDLVTGDFRIWFGARRSAADDLRGPAGLAEYVRRHRKGRDELFFALHGDPVVDVERQRAAFTWTATVPRDGGTVTVGGIDLFALTCGRLATVWSVTGSGPF